MTDNIFEGNHPTTNDEANQPKSEETKAEASTIPEGLEELIGDGKKYKSVEDALKSVPHAQSHIANLERQLEEMREDLGKRMSAEEVLKKIQEGRKEDEGTPAESQFDPDALKNLVKETYAEMSQEEKKQHNIQVANDKMKEVYGDKAVEVLKTKAQELGVDVSFLQSTAEKSPSAFYNLIGLSSKQETVNQARTNSSVNTESVSNSSGVEPYTYQWYQKMRRDNPKEYYSANVQREMHRKATELGDKFFN